VSFFPLYILVTVRTVRANEDARRLLPDILHHATVAYGPLLMVHHLQAWEHRQDFAPHLEVNPNKDHGSISVKGNDIVVFEWLLRFKRNSTSKRKQNKRREKFSLAVYSKD
jgi:hypothetical protein